MAWRVSAQLVESCSCKMLCPCWFGIQELMDMDEGWCGSPLLFRIRDGSSEGVDLAGRTVVVATYFPGPTLFDGNGTARVVVDDGASDEQRQELEAIFQGQKGGPMEIIGGLVTTWLPTQPAAIDIAEADGEFTAKVSGFGEIRSRRLANEAGQPMLLKNAGFTAALQLDDSAGHMAPSASRWADSELPQPEFHTKSGVVGSFTWSG